MDDCISTNEKIVSFGCVVFMQTVNTKQYQPKKHRLVLVNDLRKIGTKNYGLMKNTEYQFTEEHLEIY